MIYRVLLKLNLVWQRQTRILVVSIKRWQKPKRQNQLDRRKGQDRMHPSAIQADIKAQLPDLTPAQKHILGTLAIGMTSGDIKLPNVKRCFHRVGATRERPKFLPAYLAFAQNKRNEVAHLAFGDQGKALGKMWKSLSEQEKARWKNKIPLPAVGAKKRKIGNAKKTKASFIALIEKTNPGSNRAELAAMTKSDLLKRYAPSGELMY